MASPFQKSSELPPHLALLVDQYCAGTLAPEEHADLEARLRDNRQFQLFFLAYLGLHAGLYWGMRGEAAPEPTPTLAPPVGRFSGRLGSFGLYGGVVAVVAVLLLAVGIQTTGGTAHPLARLVALESAAWATDQDFAAGDKLQAGRLELLRGMAQIELSNGVTMLLEGPVELQLIAADRCILHAGYVVATVPPPAIGFRVDTPAATLIDQGTEFGVAVDATRGTTLQVFNGAVDAHCKGDTARPAERLTTGEALVLAGVEPATWRAVPFDPHRFVRRFPAPETRGSLPHEAAKPYNTSRFDSIEVVRAPQQIVIDGNLDEWDRSGAFTSHCDPPYDVDYHLTGMMMYDAEYLYLAAEVGDPLPMRSVLSPQSDPTLLWKGGSVQVRLSTDRARPWPLVDESQRRRSADVSEKLVHLTLWHHQPSAQACLHVDYGMDFHGDRVNPPGWQGTFRPLRDGRGYTLEYAVPWSLLSAEDDPPQPGDTLAANWLVHWSDEGGRLWRAQLVDICNPAVGGFTFESETSWGKAHYQ